jgi:hypothetical protein
MPIVVRALSPYIFCKSENLTLYMGRIYSIGIIDVANSRMRGSYL